MQVCNSLHQVVSQQLHFFCSFMFSGRGRSCCQIPYCSCHKRIDARTGQVVFEEVAVGHSAPSSAKMSGDSAPSLTRNPARLLKWISHKWSGLEIDPEEWEAQTLARSRASQPPPPLAPCIPQAHPAGVVEAHGARVEPAGAEEDGQQASSVAPELASSSHQQDATPSAGPPPPTTHAAAPVGISELESRLKQQEEEVRACAHASASKRNS
jgi:hypothetical protein